MRCGRSQTPPFAIAEYVDASWSAVTDTPWPMGTLPIVVPDQYEGNSPELSPRKPIPVRAPKPKRLIQYLRPDSPRYRSAIVTVPTLDDRWRIWETLIHSVGCTSASWMT